MQIYTTPEFQQNLRAFAKRHRHIQFDIQAILDELQVKNFVGDRILGVGENYEVYKVRVRNRDIQKGKSGGYRLIYLVESPTSVLLLTFIQSLTEQTSAQMRFAACYTTSTIERSYCISEVILN